MLVSKSLWDAIINNDFDYLTDEFYLTEEEYEWYLAHKESIDDLTMLHGFILEEIKQ